MDCFGLAYRFVAHCHSTNGRALIRRGNKARQVLTSVASGAVPTCFEQTVQLISGEETEHNGRWGSSDETTSKVDLGIVSSRRVVTIRRINGIERNHAVSNKTQRRFNTQSAAASRERTGGR
jgi:hypothetical protein